MLFALGLAAALVATHGDFWPVALAWLAAAALLVGLRQALSRAWFWIVLALGILALPLLAFEGGLFVLPGALAYAAAERRSSIRRGMRIRPGPRPPDADRRSPLGPHGGSPP